MNHRCLAMLSVFLLAACNQVAEPPLVASDIVIPKPLPGQAMSAGYLSLTNTSNNDIVISHVNSTEYGSVELHESVIENGVAKMRHVPELAVAANSTVELRPGGLHLMLMKPRDAERVSLSFFDDTTLLLTVSANTSERKPR